MTIESENILDTRLLGSRIKQAREALGMSQTELAELIDKDQSAVSAYEGGRRKIFATDLPSLAQALQVSILYFFQDQPNPHDLAQAILHEFEQLPSTETKKTAIKMMRLLREFFDQS